MGFTVVGIALDAEGIQPAKLYYEKFGVTFPALVDPNYATEFGAVPKTFFVNEHGVVQNLNRWEERLRTKDELESVTNSVRKLWSEPGQRLEPAAIAELVRRHNDEPEDLSVVVELASRYLELQLYREAESVLAATIGHYDPREVARSDDHEKATLLGQAFFQRSRAAVNNRKAQVHYATLSYYLNPSVGYGKQIARIIAPEKFDHRPGGDFDNDFREGTLRRLKQERAAWLQQNR